MEMAITKMSSKGQVVIPAEMRNGINEGDKFVVIKVDKQLILKTIKDFKENVEEDLEFARRTEAAIQRYESGQFKSMDSGEFVNKLDQW